MLITVPLNGQRYVSHFLPDSEFKYTLIAYGRWIIENNYWCFRQGSQRRKIADGFKLDRIPLKCALFNWDRKKITGNFYSASMGHFRWCCFCSSLPDYRKPRSIKGSIQAVVRRCLIPKSRVSSLKFIDIFALLWGFVFEFLHGIHRPQVTIFS